MTKIFDYCCKKCWHTWRSKNKFTVCPKCKSAEIDIDYDISLTE